MGKNSSLFEIIIEKEAGQHTWGQIQDPQVGQGAEARCLLPFSLQNTCEFLQPINQSRNQELGTLSSAKDKNESSNVDGDEEDDDGSKGERT